jgi:citrate synthase
MMHQEGGVKIWRPRQLYVGPEKREFVPIYKREENSTDPGNTPTAVPHSGQSKRTELAEFLGKGHHKL